MLPAGHLSVRKESPNPVSEEPDYPEPTQSRSDGLQDVERHRALRVIAEEDHPEEEAGEGKARAQQHPQQSGAGFVPTSASLVVSPQLLDVVVVLALVGGIAGFDGPVRDLGAAVLTVDTLAFEL